MLFVWLSYQLYWPLWTTKLQQFLNNLSTRLERIEITQVAISEEVAGVDAMAVKDIHGKDTLSTADLKDHGK